jgi:hypothetical protein
MINYGIGLEKEYWLNIRCSVGKLKRHIARLIGVQAKRLIIRINEKIENTFHGLNTKKEWNREK